LEVVAATDPDVLKRIERAESYRDATVANDFHADVVLQEDRDGNGEWLVSYQDDDGAMYVTVFSGPVAGRRARDYFEALKTGALKTLRDGPLEH
jgi:hypothetical protein